MFPTFILSNATCLQMMSIPLLYKTIQMIYSHAHFSIPKKYSNEQMYLA